MTARPSGFEDGGRTFAHDQRGSVSRAHFLCGDEETLGTIFFISLPYGAW